MWLWMQNIVEYLINTAKEFLLEAREAYRKRRFGIVCFLSHQAAELSLRALIISNNGEVEYSENLRKYLEFLASKSIVIPDEIYAFAEALSHHFSTVKCINNIVTQYSENQALRCIAYSEAILSFVEKILRSK